MMQCVKRCQSIKKEVKLALRFYYFSYYLFVVEVPDEIQDLQFSVNCSCYILVAFVSEEKRNIVKNKHIIL